MRVVQVHQFGAPEVLVLEEQANPQAGPGQVVVAVEAAGVAFGDIIVRSGKYPLPLPWVPGLEVSGRVIQVGPDGDQSLVGASVVAHTTNNRGGYAEQAVVEVENVFRVPAGLSAEQAAGVFLSGQTAAGILKAMDIKEGESVLITAAAGGMGSLMIQLARTFGAGTVIGAASGQEKRALISRLGADVAIDYGEEDWVEQVRKATGGKGADIVLDSVGGTIGRQAFAVTASGRGRLGVYGFSSGSWATIETPELARGVTVLRPLSIVFARTPLDLRADADFVLAEAAAGRLLVQIGQTYPLERAAEAHAAIEARQTIGKTLLIP